MAHDQIPLIEHPAQPGSRHQPQWIAWCNHDNNSVLPPYFDHKKRALWEMCIEIRKTHPNARNILAEVVLHISQKIAVPANGTALINAQLAEQINKIVWSGNYGVYLPAFLTCLDALTHSLPPEYSTKDMYRQRSNYCLRTSAVIAGGNALIDGALALLCTQNPRYSNGVAPMVVMAGISTILCLLFLTLSLKPVRNLFSNCSYGRQFPPALPDAERQAAANNANPEAQRLLDLPPQPQYQAAPLPPGNNGPR